ncbi:hypothetical protein DTS00_24655, partial [Salmonella enterica]|nr:hypothetical protein [Salmonella enterica]EBM5249663.1 hypothetical protein [Salmonella enterica]
TVRGLSSKDTVAGVGLGNVNLSAKQGEIIISGNKSATSLQTGLVSDFKGAVSVSGDVSVESLNSTINAENSWLPHDVMDMVQIPAVGLSFSAGAGLFIIGDASINVHTNSGAGILFNSFGNRASINTISISNGDLFLNASIGDSPAGKNISSAAIIFQNTYNADFVNVILDNANVNINADASGAVSNVISGFASSDSQGLEAYGRELGHGFTFKGTGNVSVTGKSARGDGVNARFLNNVDLNGSLSLYGESVSGTGVNFDKVVNATLVNADIRGKSDTGTGIVLSLSDSKSKSADLNGNTINGISETDTGIRIIGNNVTLT